MFFPRPIEELDENGKLVKTGRWEVCEESVTGEPVCSGSYSEEDAKKIAAKENNDQYSRSEPSFRM